MAKNYTTEELKEYVKTYLKNRYIEFFKNLIFNFEPNNIIPIEAFEDMVKYKYQMSTLDLVYIKRRIDEDKTTEQERALYYKLEHIKDYTIDYNKSLQQSIKLIEDYHEKIGTPLGGIFFHIYAYLVFDISAASDSYHFGNIISYMYTHDQKIRNETVETVPFRRFRKTSRLNNNKIKKRWVQKAIDSGMILDERKITNHWDKYSKQKKKSR